MSRILGTVAKPLDLIIEILKLKLRRKASLYKCSNKSYKLCHLLSVLFLNLDVESTGDLRQYNYHFISVGEWACLVVDFCTVF